MREMIENIKEDWLYYLGGLIILLFIAGFIAFVIFMAFLTAISLV